MIVVGGCYAEVCAFPDWNRIFGSGVRAAAALSSFSSPVTLYSYVPSAWLADVKATLETFGIDGRLTATSEGITFAYLTPLDKFGYDPVNPAQHEALNVKGPVVLQFGMLEGGAVVDADYAIYDPQAGGDFATFAANGSNAAHLAIVLSEEEFGWKLKRGSDRQVRAREIMDANPRAKVVVVKTPFGGASVFTGDQVGQEVPAYRSSRYFKIGTGDVFTAAFAFAWAIDRRDPLAAADFASRCAGYYADGAQLPLPTSQTIEALAPRSSERSKVSVAGNGDSLAQQSVIASAYDHLSQSFKATTTPPDFSRAPMLAPKGADSDTILGVFEGDASSIDQLAKHVVVGKHRLVLLTSGAVPSELAQRLGENLVVTDDFATALYRAAFKD